MLSTRTDEAVQMLQAGWTVRYAKVRDVIEWRSPRGISGSDYISESLDSPPDAAVHDARYAGDIVERPRVTE